MPKSSKAPPRLDPSLLSGTRTAPDPAMAAWVRRHQKEARSRLVGGLQAAAMLAREDPNAFCELVLRDERTGAPIVQCDAHVRIQLAAARARRLVLMAHADLGKSFQLGIGHLLWRIGREPEKSYAVVSKSARQALKVVGMQRALIENSAALRAVFPDLVPSPLTSDRWSDSAYTVRRRHHRRDPTVQGCGVHGDLIGSRTDVILLDDLHDNDNWRTPDAREALVQWVRNTVLSRLPEDGVLIADGTVWHKADVLHQLAAIPGVECLKFPLLDPRDGRVTRPDRFPPDHVARLRRELGPLEFARVYLCEPRDDATARFQMAWLQRALDAGAGRAPRHHLTEAHAGSATFTGVDLGFGLNKRHDPSALVTILRYPDDRVELLDADSGRWATPELVDRMLAVQRRYGSTLVVEDNAAQKLIVEVLRLRGVRLPVKYHTTGTNKWHPEHGVESIAAELAAGVWIIPTANGRLDGCAPAIRQVCEGLLEFHPDAHTPDLVMALWIARHASRLPKPGRGGYGKLRLGAA